MFPISWHLETYTCSTVVCCTMLAIIEGIILALQMSIVLAHWKKGFRGDGKKEEGKEGRGSDEEGERKGGEQRKRRD